MGGDGFEGFAPFEVVAEFLGVGFGFLAVHDFGGDGGFLLVDFADATAEGGVVCDAFGDDVAGTGEGVGCGGDFLFGVDEFRGFVVGIGGLVFEDPVGERGEAAFDGFGGAGLAFGAEGSEDVLDGGEGVCCFEFFLQFGGEEGAFFEGFEDGGAAGVEFRELEHAVADGGDLDFVEGAGLFFAVAGDEGDGGSFREEFCGGCD